MAFIESFDNGVGALSHVWGSASIDTSVPGQITLGGHGGAMERPWSADSGHGYGTYTVVAALHGDQAGPAALLWPANDQWPGPEFDIVEIHEGRPYGVVHFNDNGNDNYTSVWYDGFDYSQPHTYTLDWQPGRITFYVDGREMGTVTEGVGADYAHGGINEVFGIMNRNSDTAITVYEVSYTENGATAQAESWAPELAVAAPVPEAAAWVSPAAADWNAIAAQVLANFWDHGTWFA
jgi:beta-glucanase (GH16 family)